MHAEIASKRDEMIALCRRFDVIRLDIFGSAARGLDFDPRMSDADFLVAFAPESKLPALEQFFGLADALQNILGRSVDLVEFGAIRNPFTLAAIKSANEVVYAA